jgi:hypothetical protein
LLWQEEMLPLHPKEARSLGGGFEKQRTDLLHTFETAICYLILFVMEY